MLYIVATPIGNLGDITRRALQVLQEVDVILAEDTRTSAVLLHHYEIKTSLLSYHQFNEAARIPQLVQRLHAGEKIALISDAGSPLISDPGERLVEALQKEGLPYTVLPGPCSIIAALQLSGFSPIPFQFVGFAPKSGQAAWVRTLLDYRGTSIFFETAPRIRSTLEEFKETRICIAREITKHFEEVLVGPASTLIEKLPNPKGEFVVVVESGGGRVDLQTCLEEVQKLMSEGLTLRDAVARVAEEMNVSKRQLYQLAIER